MIDCLLLHYNNLTFYRDVAARSCVVTQNLGVKIAGLLSIPLLFLLSYHSRFSPDDMLSLLPDYGVGRYLFRSEYAVQADGSLMPVRLEIKTFLVSTPPPIQQNVI